MSLFRLIFALSCFFPFILQANSSIPYTGKLSIGGENFNQSANFSFTISDANGSIHWTTTSPLELNVRNGRYFALLGGQGTPPLPPRLFLDHSSLILKVSVDLKDGEGMRPLLPDQPITATPLALAAEYARIAESVAPGSITKDMLSADVLADLNRTQTVPSAEPSTSSFEVTPGSITHELLSPAILADLNSSISQITREMLPPSVLADLNKSISRSDLPSSVLADLNRTITREMLPASVLADLNKSITRSDLPSSVLADLNRTITKNNLGSDVLSDLNSSISLNRLSPEVLAALQVTPSISTQPFARYDWRTNSATIEARGRGHNLSYQWLKNGEAVAGANTPVLELSNPVLDDNATYSIQLTNSVGQTTSHNITLQQAIGAPGLPLAEANATQVPRNGLVLWLDPNDLNADGLADNLPTGTLIDSWKSKVGDTNATQTSEVLKPKSQPFGDTNLKAVAFDGGDYLLDDNASLPVQHIFAIYRGLYERHDVLISDNIVELVKIDHSSKGSYFYGGKFHNSTGGTVRMSANSSVGQSVFYSNWQNDLVSMTAGSAGNYNGTFAKLGIGAKTVNSSNWEGELGEILFFNRALSNTERDAVESYLADKWSIQLHADKQAAEQAAYNAAKPPAEPETGLLAYYKFEPLAIEPDKVWDHSGNDNHLTMSGFDGDPWVEGVDGKALAFDGGNSKASIGTMFDTGSMTLWANTDDPIEGNTEKNVVCYIDYHGGWTYLAFNEAIGGSGRHFALITTHTRGIVSKFDEPKSFNGWFHFAMSFNSNKNQYDYFVNGAIIQSIEIDESSRGSQGRISVSHNSSFNLGNKSTPYYKGLLDEVRVYNRSLTAAEIEGLYLQVDSPILRMAPEHNATVGTNFSLSLVADNGPTTYLAEGLPVGLSLNVSTGQITGTLSQPGYNRVFVKAMNEHGTGSDVI
ncbi:MAG: LamG-like jellyroll fold domain-containing protein, partial [Opitutales bacterium]